MSTTELVLKKLGFFSVFEITVDLHDRISFVALASARKELKESISPMIYLWASPTEKALDALYVGKAGLGVSRRMREHKHGFQHSQTGQKNRANILELLRDGRRIFVYARIAQSMALLGVNSVNLYSAEEEAAAEAFAPQWNRAVFASARSRAARHQSEDRDFASESVIGVEEGLLTLAGVDCSQILHASMLRSFYYSLDAEHQHRLSKIIDWLRTASTSSELELKIVRGYSGMPSGFNGVPTLVIAELDDSGRAKHNAWVARIPLKGDESVPFFVLLPKRKLNPSIQESSNVSVRAKYFVVRNIEDFLNGPSKYVQ